MQPQFWTDTNWILIFSIIAGSAALAYAGDVLGFKYGKQRISIFGLRPRYTSRLITAFTGMFISVVVLTILSFFSEGVRTALFRMRSLQHEIHQVTHQLQEAVLELETTRFEMEILRQDRDMLSHERSNLETMVLSLRYEAEDLRISLDRIRGEAITVQINSLLAQRAILAGSSSEAVSEIMASLEASARDTVAAMRSERFYTTPARVELVIDPEEAAKTAERAANSPYRLYVRALAAENTALDDVVAVRLESGLSHLLYLEGESIHHRLVNPAEIGFNAEEALHVFLRELRFQAIRNGVRPDPATFSVGSLEGEDFFETVEALRTKDTFTIINALAMEDIYTEGPVRIKILLE